jgi:chromosome segregation ATPase
MNRSHSRLPIEEYHNHLDEFYRLRYDTLRRIGPNKKNRLFFYNHPLSMTLAHSARQFKRQNYIDSATLISELEKKRRDAKEKLFNYHYAVTYDLAGVENDEAAITKLMAEIESYEKYVSDLEMTINELKNQRQQMMDSESHRRQQLEATLDELKRSHQEEEHNEDQSTTMDGGYMKEYTKLYNEFVDLHRASVDGTTLVVDYEPIQSVPFKEIKLHKIRPDVVLKGLDADEKNIKQE